ncbi:three-Cys-motif partner protein TcmP [Gimesia maris]|uniref:GMT-like wHTH domain-containing protein n=1 Tax=Gimesia maris TaxID=122 RepID=A0ABX5YGR5_9PLAN|nr:three-Cys-motif partner protein TcmP [Gimesia maris]EDL61720.1 hypothetical protein PM8797T_05445 [Gimesia maris DSM 8797]QEG14891.1 hypothetical protein GmarT_07280 [Gimesia maris]QGQ31726.1 three-Cys-motif partner protein TcmP [Gimesia maris]
MAKNFFTESLEQSVIKTSIVSKYFSVWAKVIKRAVIQKNSKLAYIDLFAGPGRYNDGTKSTPLLVLEQAIDDDFLRERLVTIFNDKEGTSTDKLTDEIKRLPGIENLKYKPTVYTGEVGEDIIKIFEKTRFVPTFFFVDPWGYKGLSLQLINSVLKHWGCDCVFFFNYNRINMGLNNSIVKSHMDALFGETRADLLRQELDDLDPEARELTIVETIGEALQEMGGKYVLPFRFRNKKGVRTSHHLIFVSKNIRGYEIMKDIMAKESSEEEQGVPTFEYNPSIKKQGLLFELSRPLDDLGEMLLDVFSGRTMRMIDIFNEHHVGRRFVSRNYKDILKLLEKQNKISTDPPVDKRKKGTFGDSVKVTFP